MVAALVRLRLLVLRNSLRRSVGQLVAVAIGALYGLFVLGLVVVVLFALSLAPVEVVRVVDVLGGSALTLGWTVLPLVFAVEQTLDAPHLAVYPIPLNTLLVGLLASAVVAVPGAVTMVASVCTFGSWLRMPWVAVVAVPCGILGALLCILLSRAVTSAAAGLASGRRFRETAGIVVIIPLVLLGPIVVGTMSALRHSADALPAFAEAMSWTPLGALWAVPSQVALGDPVGAILRLLIGLATMVVVVLVWRWGLARALTTPVHAAARVRARGRLGLLARLPGTRAGAVAARCLTYWFRDPRYLRQLIIALVMPLLMLFYSSLTHVHMVLLIGGPLVAFMLGVSLIADVSYDSTAFVLHMTTGVPGRADRWGRASAVLAFGAPLTTAIVLVTAGLTGEWALVPALLGLSYGLLLGGLAVCSVASAAVVFPAPAPGDNPFTTRPGANTALLGSTLLSWAVLAVMTSPEIVMLVLAVATGEPVWGWIGLAVGLVLGAVLLVVGVRVGGGLLDRRAPELLVQLEKNA